MFSGDTFCLLKHTEDCQYFGEKRLFETPLPYFGLQALLSKTRLSIAEFGELVFISFI
jgi:hypothetical protein